MCQSCNLNLCLEIIRGHLVAGGFASREFPQGGENESASFFSIMFDSRSVSVQRSSAVLRNVSGNAPTACAHRTPNDAERVFQCQGDESLAAELIISITHGRVAQTPPPTPRPHPLGFHHKCQPVWQWPPEWVGGNMLGGGTSGRERWLKWRRIQGK